MPYIVNPVPGTPRWGDYLGQGIASGADKGLDLLLQALLSGQLAPRMQGNYTSPTGAQTQTSPAEVSRGGNVPFDRLLQQRRPQGSSYQRIGGLQFQPPLTRQLQQAQLQQAQRDLDPNSPENRLKSSQSKLYDAYASQYGKPAGANGDGSAPTPTDNTLSQEEQRLLDDAEDGDEEAIEILRLLGWLD